MAVVFHVNTQSSLFLMLTGQEPGGGGSLPRDVLTQSESHTRPACVSRLRKSSRRLSEKQWQRKILKSNYFPFVFNYYKEWGHFLFVFLASFDESRINVLVIIISEAQTGLWKRKTKTYSFSVFFLHYLQFTCFPSFFPFLLVMFYI